MATVTLSDELQRFVDAEALANGHADASEYLAVLIRREQKRQAKERLQALILLGMKSGDPADITAEVWAEIQTKINPNR